MLIPPPPLSIALRRTTYLRHVHSVRVAVGGARTAVARLIEGRHRLSLSPGSSANGHKRLHGVHLVQRPLLHGQHALLRFRRRWLHLAFACHSRRACLGVWRRLPVRPGRRRRRFSQRRGQGLPAKAPVPNSVPYSSSSSPSSDTSTITTAEGRSAVERGREPGHLNSFPGGEARCDADVLEVRHAGRRVRRRRRQAQHGSVARCVLESLAETHPLDLLERARIRGHAAYGGYLGDDAANRRGDAVVSILTANIDEVRRFQLRRPVQIAVAKERNATFATYATGRRQRG